MTVEQHTRASKIVEQVEAYVKHKKNVQSIADRDGDDKQETGYMLRFYRSNYDSVVVKDDLLPIPLNTFKTLYIAAIDAKIKALETEFANI